MKLLLISNSFGVNLQKYAKFIAEANDFDLDIYTLYIGGCSLETHDKNIKENSKNYELFYNGNSTGKLVSINEMILSEKWDLISLQQASHLSGYFSSYFPYLKNVYSYVREFNKNAKIIFHKTWPYSGKKPSKFSDVNSWMPDFNFKNEVEMEKSINDAVDKVTKQIKFDYILDSGEVIFKGSKTFENLYDNEGFHLNDLGCYLIGLNLIKMLSNKPIKKLFIPKEIGSENCKKMLEFINENF